MTKIKICGLVSTADAEIVNAVKADYAGVVMFFPKSHRNTEPERAAEIVAAVNDDIKTVAVTVAPSPEQAAVIEQCGFDILQVHGELSDEVLEKCNIPILKAFNAGGTEHLSEYNGIDKIIGYVFDAAEPGSGKTFDLSLLNGLDFSDKPVILAGGLNLYNVSHAIEAVHPYGVDVSSGVENDNGIGKSPIKTAQFTAAVRDADSKE